MLVCVTVLTYTELWYVYGIRKSEQQGLGVAVNVILMIEQDKNVRIFLGLNWQESNFERRQ